MPKLVIKGAEAREKVVAGVNELADIVKTTLGPQGRNVILDRGMGAPVITNDGVTIAKTISFTDPYMQAGALLVKQAAEKTNEIAGDGTTTATVLTQAIIKGGDKIDSDMDVHAVRRGMSKAVAFIVSRLKELARPIESHEDIAQVGTISSLLPEVGEMIATCMDEVGKDGIITVEEGQTLGLTKDIVKGLRFEKGFVSPYMVTDLSKMESNLENVHILITDKKINSVDDIVPAMEKIIAGGQKQMMIVCEDIGLDVLGMVIINKTRGVFNALVVKAPTFGDHRKDMLRDLAAITGGEVISDETGTDLKTVEVKQMGKARRVVAGRDHTTFVDGQGDPTAYLEALRAELAGEADSYNKEWLQQRLGKLTGGVAIIKVGAETEVEMKNRKLKIEDAINAVKAAVEEGVIPGAGMPLYNIANDITPKMTEIALPDETVGVEIIQQAIRAPFEQIAKNSGKDLLAFSDTVTDDVIDPVKVTRTALEKAASIAGELLTTEAIVINTPDEPK